MPVVLLTFYSLRILAGKMTISLYSVTNKLPVKHFIIPNLRGAMVLITQNFDPAKIEWIKCSFLKFSQLRDVVHRIRTPHLFHFEM